MPAMLTMPPMAKKSQQGEGKSVSVSFRLTPEEAATLDRAAESQSVPVDRSTLLAFIVRKWLRMWDEEEEKIKPKGR
jgi:hypothetical protein